MYQVFIKRGFDIVISIVALVLLFIPLLVVAIWIKLDSQGPVFFKHLRSGKKRVPFMVYKFRSMAVDAPSDNPTNSFKNAHAYITRSGKIMRKLSIDELPQLINVLKGDMSIVGPRPVVLKETRLLKLRDKYGANDVKPGITGWAQVNGRDELVDSVKARMDGEYVSKFGFRMDMKCLMMTVWAVLSIKGHTEGHEADESRFEADENIFDRQVSRDEG